MIKLNMIFCHSLSQFVALGYSISVCLAAKILTIANTRANRVAIHDEQPALPTVVL